MKKISLGLIGLVLVFTTACTKSCRPNDRDKKEVLRIGTNANMPPYESIDDKGELVGFDIDVGRKLADILGREVQFREFDFDALVLALKKDQIDIILSGLSITDSRQKEIAMIPYTGTVMSSISLLFWQELPEDINELDDLKSYVQKNNESISVQAGHFLEDFLSSEGMKVKSLAGPPEQLLDIKYDKSLAAALDGPNAESLARAHSELKILTLELPKNKQDLGYGIGIKKSRTELIEEVSSAVKKMIEDKTIEKLKQRWFKEEL